MARKYLKISELKSGTKVEACYLLQNFQVRPKKDGGNFVTLVLRDATGKLTGVMWDNFDSLTAGLIKENDFVEVAGDVLTYNGQLQFKATRVTKVPDDEVDGSYFMPRTQVPMAELEATLADLRGQIKDADYKLLIDTIFASSEFMDRFRRAPSAVSMHQAFLGGLFEHTLCVVKNALKIADNYPQANRSLLICAGLLHDIGKTVEFSYEKKIVYCDVGRLLGHISIGNAMVEVQCSRLPNFPMGKKVLVQHMILSHHGFLEFGSPKLPQTLEALILHHADLIDAQLANFIENMYSGEESGARWEYSNMLERQIYRNTTTEIEGSELMRLLSYGTGRPRSVPSPEDYARAVPADDLLQGAV
ncbi:MAG: HD domain-containing protein [Candidatus Sumerlaeaceae bacterium]|nr:HD domain-containing protein [Candidatus Sumerlaeaceae bacterium]